MKKIAKKQVRKVMNEAMQSGYREIRLRMVREICAMTLSRRLLFAWKILTKQFKEPTP